MGLLGGVLFSQPHHPSLNRNKSESKSPFGASQVAQVVKNLPAMQEIQVQSLGWEDPMEKGMATHSIIVSWRIQQAEEPGGLQSVGSQRVGLD